MAAASSGSRGLTGETLLLWVSQARCMSHLSAQWDTLTFLTCEMGWRCTSLKVQVHISTTMHL